MKREKSWVKFFAQMWKGVKGFLKVLKENKSLPTFRPDEDRDELATWNNDGVDEDSDATDMASIEKA